MRIDIHAAATPRKIRGRTSSAFLRLDLAIEALNHPDGRMVQMQTVDGATFFILPIGGRVTAMVAAEIVKRPDIVGAPDPLFPGLPRTWRRLK